MSEVDELIERGDNVVAGDAARAAAFYLKALLLHLRGDDE